MNYDKIYEIIKFIQNNLVDYNKYCNLRKVLYHHVLSDNVYFEMRDQLKLDIQWACAKDIDRNIDGIVGENTELSDEMKEIINDLLPKIRTVYNNPTIQLDIDNLPKPKRKSLYNVDCDSMRKCILSNHIQLTAFPGNDWTLISDHQMKILANNGFKIECFGSPYNTRLPWFGSLNEWDKLWGSLGKFDQIIDKLISGEDLKSDDQIIYKSTDDIRITVNPPSGKIQLETYKKIMELIEKRNTKIDIIFHFSKYQEEIINNLKEKNIPLKLLTVAWDLTNGKKINMMGREWYECRITK